MPRISVIVFLALWLSVTGARAQKGRVECNEKDKQVTLSVYDGKLILGLDYAQGGRVSRLCVNGRDVLAGTGAFTGFKTRGGTFTSMTPQDGMQLNVSDNGVTLSGITFGDNAVKAVETWQFRVKDDKIVWDIDRTYSTLAKLEETYFPQWHFADLSVWKGGILDNGGMVWCKYLRNPYDTYSVHTGGVTFWNPENGDALRIASDAVEDQLASKFTQGNDREFLFTQCATRQELEQRYNLDRFVGQHTDPFAPFNVEKAENVHVTLELSYVDYNREYSRGNLQGINADAVRELMNTTGRYGVVDNGIVGANGWTSNWKCLHEPFFSLIGLALNDSNYVRNMASSLDRERDYAIQEDGRVLSRWHNGDEDQMPGTYNYKTGYYEARWGYTIDSQTGHVLNVADLFDLNGDLEWLRSHKQGCELALDWLIRRDTNNNGIFEMMNDACTENLCSDWLDIVWASFENGFVNAQLYGALRKWSECERLLGDEAKADRYAAVASRLKENFNKPVDQGGFWLPEKKQFIYWRDKDGSPHGQNLVTPVNFAVIAYGLSDDEGRISQILDQIEQRSVAENLFHWPLCFDSFEREEVSDGNWPFPKYENGDIFPTWGYMGIRAYTHYNKDIALKYIRNLLKQYRIDGLSSQRYNRVTQKGEGSDILAGICTSIIGLYRDIYGVCPKWNRMGLEPHLSKALNGTCFNYSLRGTDYRISISVNDYEMQTERFTIRSAEAFGAAMNDNMLSVYPHNEEQTVLHITRDGLHPVNIVMKKCTDKELAWEFTSPDNYRIVVEGLDPRQSHKAVAGGKTQPLEVNADGIASFTSPGKSHVRVIASR